LNGRSYLHAASGVCGAWTEGAQSVLFSALHALE
jgi:hypothetical protein